jgi:hypothetical protein
MVKYNTTEYMHGNAKYVFVTRGKSAPFTKEEILAYIAAEDAAAAKQPKEESKAKEVAVGLAETFLANGQFVGVPAQKKSPFVVPEARENIFLADLKRGLIFCMNKYGATSEGVVSEAKRVFPSLNLTKLWEKKETSDGVKGQAKRL